VICSVVAALAVFSTAQGNYRAQLRGVISDATGAVVANATMTIRENATNISSSARTDDKGSYFFTGLRPSTYGVKVDAPGFRAAERTGVVLAVDQESSLNFKLALPGVSSMVEVTSTAPLLDTGNATLGTDVTSQYVKELPLVNRDFFGLTFLAGGVTEAAGSGTQDNYPSGTNFVSNGQRNATAEVRLDGSPLSAPEQGEGGNSNVYYEPLVEGVQEFKVQNTPRCRWLRVPVGCVDCRYRAKSALVARALRLWIRGGIEEVARVQPGALQKIPGTTVSRPSSATTVARS
jgi:Carboxypeptidase regulatory-like domain